MPYLEEMTTGKYVEAVLTGGIGVAKTTLALYATAYELYLLSLMRNPHAEFGLDPSSEIVMIFQSLNANLAKTVDYMRFKSLIDNAPYFQEFFPFDRSIESELRFPRRILVKSVAGGDKAAIGQNVIGGIIDEVNFMSVIENSKSTLDGGTYDQAKQNYEAIARRRESRFLFQGELAGLLCLVSSKQYPGQFTDKKQEEAKTNPKIFVYDKRVWEIRPEAFDGGDWFPLFLGSEFSEPRIVPKAEVDHYPEEEILWVPDVYRHAFEVDMLNAMRDIAGLSTLAKHPFIPNITQISTCFDPSLKSILSRDDCDFKTTKVQMLPTYFRRVHYPRFVHLDLALTSDSAGVACGYCPGFTNIRRGDSIELLPNIVIDFVLEIKPPPGGEIEFENIRRLLYRLKEIGLPIKWVTMDSFQSSDTMQILSNRGYMVGYSSMDTTTKPYDVLKTTLMDGRVLMPLHTKTLDEVKRLERDPEKGKIDHPPNGSKDCADALCGVVHGLTTRREIWVKNHVPLNRIPKWLIDAERKDKRSLDGKYGEGLSI